MPSSLAATARPSLPSAMTSTFLRTLGAAAFLALGTSVSAQTEAAFTHYIIQPTLLNPALVGFDGEHEGRLNYRAAAAGLSDGPATYAAGYTGAIDRNYGVGAQVFAEDEGRFSRYGLRLASAFHTRVRADLEVAGGFAVAYSRERLRPGDGGEVGLDVNDPELVQAMEGEHALDASLGFHARHRSGAFAGVVLPRLVAAYLGDADGTARGERGGPDNFIVRVGKQFTMPARSFRVTPSLTVQRLYGVPFRVDAAATAGFLDDRFVAGLGYRLGEGSDLGVLLGVRVDKMRAYYSYDVNFGEFQSYHAGGHELTLGFDFRSRNKWADGARYE